MPYCGRGVGAHVYLWQLRHNEAELMITEKLQEGQSLIRAMHQLLDALQGHFLIDLSLGYSHRDKMYKGYDVSEVTFSTSEPLICLINNTIDICGITAHENVQNNVKNLHS